MGLQRASDCHSHSRRRGLKDGPGDAHPWKSRAFIKGRDSNLKPNLNQPDRAPVQVSKPQAGAMGNLEREIRAAPRQRAASPSAPIYAGDKAAGQVTVSEMIKA